MIRRYKGANAGFWDAPETEGFLKERLRSNRGRRVAELQIPFVSFTPGAL